MPKAGSPAKKVELLYDPVGRVFRKEYLEDDVLAAATHYYYSGGNLIQEFDEMYKDLSVVDELTWDYLRGLGGQVVRRRKREEGVADQDMLHFNDMMGSVREECNPELAGTAFAGTPNGFVTTADGEPLKIQQPEEQEAYYVSSHSQYHGGFLEDKNFHTDPVADGVMGYFYRMGIRHYSPSLGRFLQRDPFSYLRAPHKSSPLSLNPYPYALNRPTQISDTSGYQGCPGPGCGVPSGNVTSAFGIPMQAGGDSGTDSGNGNDGNNGNTSPPVENAHCDIPYPEECYPKDIPKYCKNKCCKWSTDPPWFSACCLKAIWIFGDQCAGFLPERNPWDVDSCYCACCWAKPSSDEHSPKIASAWGGGGTFGCIGFG